MDAKPFDIHPNVRTLRMFRLGETKLTHTYLPDGDKELVNALLDFSKRGYVCQVASFKEVPEALDTIRELKQQLAAAEQELSVMLGNDGLSSS
jgi:hypothetical protein